MILNETYDEILNKLDLYNIGNNNYLVESEEIISNLYESYIIESKNNKQFSAEWKKLKSDFFKSFNEARKLANKGNYKEAISKIESCEKNLIEGFNQLSNNTKFTLADNILAMIKFFIIPVILLLVSAAFLKLTEKKSKNILDNNYDLYVKKGAALKLLGMDDDTIYNVVFTKIYPNDVKNNKTIKLLLKLANITRKLGIGTAYGKSVEYCIQILQSMVIKVDNDSENVVNANYNSVKSLIQLLMVCTSIFKKEYEKKMRG